MKLVLIHIVAILFSSIICASVINVPDDKPNIQAGVDAAIDGDTVLLASGYYTGSGNWNIRFGGKAILVTSSGAPEACVVDGAGNHRLFQFLDNENSILENITLKNGFSSTSDGGSVQCEDASPTINKCVFLNNSIGSLGGAIYTRNGSINISHCLFSGNSSGSCGGAIRADHAHISHCRFEFNVSQSGGAIQGWDNIVEDCSFVENNGLKGGAIYISGESEVLRCDFQKNSANPAAPFSLQKAHKSLAGRRRMRIRFPGIMPLPELILRH